MKNSTGPLLFGAVLSVVLVLAASEAVADDPIKVTRLRTSKVSLYDKPNGTKALEFSRDQFKGPWLVTQTSAEGFLQVDVEGKMYWVRPYAVETDKPVRANAECGAVIASREPKAAATRGLGEECKR